MVAAREEIDPQKALHERLERWAVWARGPSIGGSGGAIGYLRERLDPGADSDEFTDEVMVTERAVARTKLEEKAYWRVIAKYYLGRMSIAEIAPIYHVSEGSLERLFAAAKSCVRRHIYDIETGA